MSVNPISKLPKPFQEKLAGVYQDIVYLNYCLELYPFHNKGGNGTYRTYELVNASKNDDMLQEIINNLTGSEIFYDIGANVGQYSFAVSAHDKDIEAHAFEPNPSIYAHLCKNIQVNGLNVIPHGRPVGNDVSIVDFYISSDRGSGSMTRDNAARFSVTGEVKLQSVSIDKLEGVPDPDIIKIDAEGQLIDILDGAKDTLQSKKPEVYFESHHQYENISFGSEEYNQIFEDLGYNVSERNGYTKASPR